MRSRTIDKTCRVDVLCYLEDENAHALFQKRALTLMLHVGKHHSGHFQGGRPIARSTKIHQLFPKLFRYDSIDFPSN